MIGVLKSNVIEGLRYLADYRFQKTAWFANDQGLCASYIENVLWVFDDTSLSDALDDGEIVFGKEADEALRDLYLATEAIDEFKQSDAEIIDSSEMQIVRDKAAHALLLVQQSDTVESTVPIYVKIKIRILNTAPHITRETLAEELKNGYYKIYATNNFMHSYPQNEIWEFNTGDVVRCVMTSQDGKDMLLATERI